MPLRDHFQPPIFPIRRWESFQSQWANALAAQLNAKLPRRFFAEAQIHLGSQVEADVVELERLEQMEESSDDVGGGVAVEVWAPPVATMTCPAVFPDDIEVHVRDELFDARVVAVVELVSPANKDRPENRLAFSDKSAAYLERGIGLITLDIVTSRHFNLHNELMSRLGMDSKYAMSEDEPTYAVAYRPIRRGSANLIDIWPTVLWVGTPLPVLPLSLRGFRAVPIDLEAAYEDACHRSRL